MTILYAGLLLGALGIIFGGVLTFASKKFHVEVDERAAIPAATALPPPW